MSVALPDRIAGCSSNSYGIRQGASPLLVVLPHVGSDVPPDKVEPGWDSLGGERAEPAADVIRRAAEIVNLSE